MTLDRSIILRVNRIVGVVGLVVGLAIASAAGFWIARTMRFTASAATTDGRVVANERHVWQDRDSHGSSTTRTSYRAVVRYTDRAGRSLVYRDTIALNPPSFAVGQRVRMLYDAERPERALIDRGARIYVVPLAILVVGGLMLLGSVQRLFDRRLAGLADIPAVPQLTMSSDVVTRPPAM